MQPGSGKQGFALGSPILRLPERRAVAFALVSPAGPRSLLNTLRRRNVLREGV
jgi:hypothetical protein